MGDLSEFSLSVRLFLKAYRWRRVDPVPCTQLERPLSESKVALVTSAGFILPGQTPFDDAVKGGDSSFREIPGEADIRSLIECHRSKSFDHSGIQDDPNMGLPLDRLRELEQGGGIGAVNHRHLSFMGSITAPGRLIKQDAPRAAELLVEDKVDAVLLVPV